jgi:hypothetical protein
MVAAGLDAQTNAGDRQKWEETRDLIIPRWRAGESYAEIARDFNTTGQAMGRRVRRYLRIERELEEAEKSVVGL